MFFNLNLVSAVCMQPQVAQSEHGCKKKTFKQIYTWPNIFPQTHPSHDTQSAQIPPLLDDVCGMPRSRTRSPSTFDQGNAMCYTVFLCIALDYSLQSGELGFP